MAKELYDYHEYREKFRKEGRYWKDLTEKEKELMREAYKKRFGREMQEPRTLVERWLYEADRHPLKITEKPNKQE